MQVLGRRWYYSIAQHVFSFSSPTPIQTIGPIHIWSYTLDSQSLWVPTSPVRLESEYKLRLIGSEHAIFSFHSLASSLPPFLLPSSTIYFLHIFSPRNTTNLGSQRGKCQEYRLGIRTREPTIPPNSHPTAKN